MDSDIFVLCDTRLSPTDEGPFKKLWGKTVLFNSHSGDKRGIAALIRDGTPIENINFQNIIKGNFSNLSFKAKNENVLIKCIYAPNIDMNTTGLEKESRAFFKQVFDDSDEDKYIHKVRLGDFNERYFRIFTHK